MGIENDIDDLKERVARLESICLTPAAILQLFEPSALTRVFEEVVLPNIVDDHRYTLGGILFVPDVVYLGHSMRGARVGILSSPGTDRTVWKKFVPILREALSEYTKTGQIEFDIEGE